MTRGQLSAAHGISRPPFYTTTAQNARPGTGILLLFLSSFSTLGSFSPFPPTASPPMVSPCPFFVGRQNDASRELVHAPLWSGRYLHRFCLLSLTAPTWEDGLGLSFPFLLRSPPRLERSSVKRALLLGTLFSFRSPVEALRAVGFSTHALEPLKPTRPSSFPFGAHIARASMVVWWGGGLIASGRTSNFDVAYPVSVTADFFSPGLDSS